MKRDDIFAIVMAGGRGERFWPQSRQSHPKQLLRLIGNLTLIEQTVDRLTPLIPTKNIIVITNRDYVAPMCSLLSDLPQNNIIGEPVGRDTAPCVALAAALVKSKSSHKNPKMILLPADHVINDSESMLKVLNDSADVAESGDIVTIGITPTFASTGYGYIQCGEKIDNEFPTVFYKSKGFKEKPPLEQAEKFLATGDYKWNSGMFIWSLSTITKAFEKHAPRLAESLEKLANAAEKPDFMDILAEEYSKLDKISIDYAVMEKVDNVVVAESSFDWDDVGSWTALRNQIRPETNNNVVRGLHLGLDSSDNIIVSDAKHLVATVDVKDMIIIHTDDATLVCNGKSAQRIKELVHLLGDQAELSKYT
jgi:mannose-1-phosphate guanylyltransferase